MKKMKEKFWKAIHRLAKQEIKKAHLTRVGNDIKCPGCNEWFSVSGIEHKHKMEKPVNKEYYVAVCGQCGTKSNWNPNIAPVLIRVDDTGSPITTKRQR